LQLSLGVAPGRPVTKLPINNNTDSCNFSRYSCVIRNMNVSGVSLTHIKHEEVWRRMPVKNQFRCPKCASIVYSRKSRCCGVCGITLPESFAFSIEETEALKSLLES